MPDIRFPRAIGFEPEVDRTIASSFSIPAIVGTGFALGPLTRLGFAPLQVLPQFRRQPLGTRRLFGFLAYGGRFSGQIRLRGWRVSFFFHRLFEHLRVNGLVGAYPVVRMILATLSRNQLRIDARPVRTRWEARQVDKQYAGPKASRGGEIARTPTSTRVDVDHVMAQGRNSVVFERLHSSFADVAASAAAQTGRRNRTVEGVSHGSVKRSSFAARYLACLIGGGAVLFVYWFAIRREADPSGAYASLASRDILFLVADLAVPALVAVVLAAVLAMTRRARDAIGSVAEGIVGGLVVLGCLAIAQALL